MSAEYKTCLGDYEPILPELARIIDAPYASGDYTKFEDDFLSSRTEEDKYWELIGTRGTIRILLEPHDAYFFSWFHAEDPWFKAGKELLWKEYIREGGNPGAQEPP
ncbi:MAG: hypothetical protein ACREFF_06025 [Candidatus Udaeobacter sp.]